MASDLVLCLCCTVGVHRCNLFWFKAPEVKQSRRDLIHREIANSASIVQPLVVLKASLQKIEIKRLGYFLISKCLQEEHVNAKNLF